MNDLENDLAWVLIGMILLIFVLVIAFLKKNNIERAGPNNAREGALNKENEGK